MDLVQLIHRSSTTLHLRPPPGLHVPLHVIVHLSKGAKFIPDRLVYSASKVWQSFAEFEERICEKIPRTVDNSLENKSAVRSLHRKQLHAQIKRFNSSRQKTGPQGPLRGNSHLRHTLLALRRDLVREYVGSRKKKSLSWLDREASHWLKIHRDLVQVVDADKGLGDVLVCRRWVKTEILRLLEDGFEKLDNDQFLKHRMKQRYSWPLSLKKHLDLEFFEMTSSTSCFPSVMPVVLGDFAFV